MGRFRPYCFALSQRFPPLGWLCHKSKDWSASPRHRGSTLEPCAFRPARIALKPTAAIYGRDWKATDQAFWSMRQDLFRDGGRFQVFLYVLFLAWFSGHPIVYQSLGSGNYSPDDLTNARIRPSVIVTATN